MNLSDIQFIFNRAASQTFHKKKLLFVSCILLMCGLLVVFFRGLSLEAGSWLSMSLTFLPIFLCAGILLSTGIVLIRIYHDEIKNRPVSYLGIFGKSWDLVLGASYFTVPIILCYLLLWMLLGIFFLLREIPTVGHFFGVVFSFGPFIINLGSLALCVLNIALLFFLTPVIALRGMNRTTLSNVLMGRLKSDLFSNIFLALIGTFPLLFFIGLGVLAAVLTGSVCTVCSDASIYTTLLWFFVMIPFVVLMAPAVVFFFNFAAESHVLLQKRVNAR